MTDTIEGTEAKGSDKSTTTLTPKTIFELFGENFFIPSYQRGYRWKEEHVEALLSHIWEFANAKNTGSFYCLQPIVVKKREEDGTKIELIDGQQRLTTIYIILKYFMSDAGLKEYINDKFSSDKKDIFTIDYATRGNSKGFLENINEEENKKKDAQANIDFFHMDKAYKAVCKWGEALQAGDKKTFLDVLLGKENDPKSVQVIYYEIPSKDSTLSYELFKRLNIGKIRLTNAELVKAVFLKNWDNSLESDVKSFELKQIQIATEWDIIEKKLQDDSFWYFICNSSYEYITRIEYLFDIIAEKQAKEDPQEYFTFNYFYKEVNEDKKDNEKVDTIDGDTEGTRAKKVNSPWDDVKSKFNIFDTWYNDNELYHLVGFIIVTNTMKIEDLISLHKESTKSGFRKKLKYSIEDRINKIKLQELVYGNKNEDIKYILLLFNIVTMIKSNNARMKFPFDLYKNKIKGWDIEHIHSQTLEDPTKRAEALLRVFCEDFEIAKEALMAKKNSTDNEKSKINIFLRAGKIELKDTENFNKLKSAAKSLSGEKSEDKNFFEWFNFLCTTIDQYYNIKVDVEGNIDTIGNLALLDSRTNRSYQNAPFIFKRKIILTKDREGTFIPICTKNVFVKAYSQTLTNPLKWDSGDIDSYATQMERTIYEYLGIKKGEADEC